MLTSGKFIYSFNPHILLRVYNEPGIVLRHINVCMISPMLSLWICYYKFTNLLKWDNRVQNTGSTWNDNVSWNCSMEAEVSIKFNTESQFMDTIWGWQ